MGWHDSQIYCLHTLCNVCRPTKLVHLNWHSPAYHSTHSLFPSWIFSNIPASCRRRGPLCSPRSHRTQTPIFHCDITRRALCEARLLPNARSAHQAAMRKGQREGKVKELQSSLVSGSNAMRISKPLYIMIARSGAFIHLQQDIWLDSLDTITLSLQR